jgi:hypothetical protein
VSGVGQGASFGDHKIVGGPMRFVALPTYFRRGESDLLGDQIVCGAAST